MATKKRSSKLASVTEDAARLQRLAEKEKLPPHFNLAFAHEPFMRADETRGARLLLEYERVERQLIAQGVESTATFFGSASINPDHRFKNAVYDVDHAEGVYGLTRDMARAITEKLVSPSRESGALRSVIATGGGPGLMEAANLGAHLAGGPSIGFCKTLPSESKPNAYITEELCFLFHYFAIRKLHLALRANAFICMPGGYGTLDEIFEVLTLRKTGGMHEVTTIFVGTKFWREAVNFDLFVEEGLAPAPDRLNVFFSDSIDEVVEILEEAGRNGEGAARTATG